MNGLAFSFQSNSGAAVGSFQIGTTSAVNANAVPFTTNAAGKVTNLNADHVDERQPDRQPGGEQRGQCPAGTLTNMPFYLRVNC